MLKHGVITETIYMDNNITIHEWLVYGEQRLGVGHCGLLNLNADNWLGFRYLNVATLLSMRNLILFLLDHGTLMDTVGILLLVVFLVCGLTNGLVQFIGLLPPIAIYMMSNENTTTAWHTYGYLSTGVFIYSGLYSSTSSINIGGSYWDFATYTHDAIYMESIIISTRQWLSYGHLTSGVTSGLSTLGGSAGLGNLTWSFATNNKYIIGGTHMSPSVYFNVKLSAHVAIIPL